MDRTMVVEGEGVYEARPDSARFECTLQGRYPEYAEAVEHSTGCVAPLREAVEAAGFPADSLLTVGVTVRPVYDSRREGDDYISEFAGYEYVHRLRIDVPCDNVTVGKLMTSLQPTGVQFSMSYRLKNNTEALSKARSLAVMDAQLKAEKLAEDAGVRLGDLVTITYSSGSAGPEYRTLSARANMPDMVPESIAFTDSVELTWEFY